MRMNGTPFLLLGALVSGCSSDSYTAPAPAPAPAPPAATNVVAVTSNQFTPAALTVARNTTVTWNFNSGTHNVVFEDGQGSSADQSSGSHARTFAVAGAFRYRCTIHSSSFTSGMIGAVQVN